MIYCRSDMSLPVNIVFNETLPCIRPKMLKLVCPVCGNTFEHFKTRNTGPKKDKICKPCLYEREKGYAREYQRRKRLDRQPKKSPTENVKSPTTE